MNIYNIKTLYFLIEKDTEDHMILNSFGYEIVNAIKYEKWFRGNTKYEFFIVDKFDLEKGFKNKQFVNSDNILFIPIGTIEFVEIYFNVNNINIPKPLNVPTYLRNSKFVNRNIEDITISQLQDNLTKYKNYYIKSNERYKHFDIIKGKDYFFFYRDIKVENLFASSEILPEIDSEFRSFVTNNKLISIRPYISDFVYSIKQEDVNILNEIIEIVKINEPNLTTFTIDYAILKDGSFEVIELQHPYSVGNYGFDGTELLEFYLKGFLSLIK